MSFFSDLLLSILGIDNAPAHTSSSNRSSRVTNRKTSSYNYNTDKVREFYAREINDYDCVATWLRESYENKSILTVRITDKNDGGYLVEFDDSTEGFMPLSHSGYDTLYVNDTVHVLIIGITDKPIVSIKEATKAKKKSIYQTKVNLLNEAKALLEMGDVESAIASYQELREKWEEAGHVKQEKELWEEFKEVNSQLRLRSKEQEQVNKLRRRRLYQKWNAGVYFQVRL